MPLTAQQIIEQYSGLPLNNAQPPNSPPTSLAGLNGIVAQQPTSPTTTAPLPAQSVSPTGTNPGTESPQTTAEPAKQWGPTIYSGRDATGTGVSYTAQQAASLPFDVAVATFGYQTARKLNQDNKPIDEKIYEAGTTGASMLGEMGKMYGLENSDLFVDLVRQYDATTRMYGAMGKDGREPMEQYVQQFTAQLPGLLTQIKDEQEQQDQMALQQQERNTRIMQLQSQFAPIFNSIAQGTLANNNLVYDRALQSADVIKESDPQLAALIVANAGAAQQSGDALLAAYANQIAMTPAIVADMFYQQDMQAMNAFGSQGLGALMQAYQQATQPTQ
jgi:hypothetical protein